MSIESNQPQPDNNDLSRRDFLKNLIGVGSAFSLNDMVSFFDEQREREKGPTIRPVAVLIAGIIAISPLLRDRFELDPESDQPPEHIRD